MEVLVRGKPLGEEGPSPRPALPREHSEDPSELEDVLRASHGEKYTPRGNLRLVLQSEAMKKPLAIPRPLKDEELPLLEALHDLHEPGKEAPGLLLEGEEEGCRVRVYRGKKGLSVLFQGERAEEEFRRSFPGEEVPLPKKKEMPSSREKAPPSLFPQIGSDEVGTGDAFGPIVVVAAYVEEKDLGELSSLGVRDSKELTDEEVLALAPRLMKFPSARIVLSPTKYNKMQREGKNMNAIKALLHDHAQRLLAGKFPGARRYLDQFCSPALFQKYVREAGIEPLPGIQMATKGESRYPSVALASLIARARFLEEMRRMGEEEGMAFPKGAGAPVDSFLKEYVRKKGPEALERVAKLNFRNFRPCRGD